MNVWITPPDYTGLQPMISTPAGLRFQHETLDIPKGSALTPICGKDGETPRIAGRQHPQQSSKPTHMAISPHRHP